jgi:hypothetical protein
MNTAEDFALQMAIWGYAVTGESGMVSKVAEEYPLDGYPGWDKPWELDRTFLTGKRPPDFYACYWICEHIRRGHAVLPEQ